MFAQTAAQQPQRLFHTVIDRLVAHAEFRSDFLVTFARKAAHLECFAIRSGQRFDFGIQPSNQLLDGIVFGYLRLLVQRNAYGIDDTTTHRFVGDESKAAVAHRSIEVLFRRGLDIHRAAIVPQPHEHVLDYILGIARRYHLGGIGKQAGIAGVEQGIERLQSHFFVIVRQIGEQSFMVCRSQNRKYRL